jgi:hypothetical protein
LNGDQSLGYHEVLGPGESLAHFLSAMRDFDKSFCDSMASGADFTLKLEIHGDGGKMLHARVTSDVFRRPSKNSRDSV